MRDVIILHRSQEGPYNHYIIASLQVFEPDGSLRGGDYFEIAVPIS